MMVDVRPWPKAFRPPDQQQQQQQQQDGGEQQQPVQPRCFYYMGLSKKKVSGQRVVLLLGFSSGHKHPQPCALHSGERIARVALPSPLLLATPCTGWGILLPLAGHMRDLHACGSQGTNRRVGSKAKQGEAGSQARVAHLPAPAPCPCLQPQVYNQYSQALVIPQSKVDLTSPVNEFAHKVKEWEQRRAGMDIAVRHLLQRHLPDWVRPQRAGAPPAEAAAGRPPLTGVKRPSDGNESAEAAAAAKRQQTGAMAALPTAHAEAVAAAGAGAAENGTSGPPSRGNSDLQMADLQRQQEVDAAAAVLAACPAWHAPPAMNLLCICPPAACLREHARFCSAAFMRAPTKLPCGSCAHLLCLACHCAAGTASDSSRRSRSSLRAESRVPRGVAGGSGGCGRLDSAAV